jgi:hypothetical protein
MTTPSSESRAKFRKLLQRAIQIAVLFPDPENIDPSEETAIAEVKMLLTEFNKVDSEMREMLEKCSH